MEAAGGLDGAHREVVFAIWVAEVEIVGALDFHVTVIVTIKAEGEEGSGGIPVEFFMGEEGATLKDEDALCLPRQCGERGFHHPLLS